MLMLFDHLCVLPAPPQNEMYKPVVAGHTQSSDAVLGMACVEFRVRMEADQN